MWALILLIALGWGVWLARDNVAAIISGLQPSSQTRPAPTSTLPFARPTVSPVEDPTPTPTSTSASVAGFDGWIDSHPVFGVSPEAAAQAKAVARDVCYSLEDGFGSFGMVLLMLVAGAQPPPGLDSRQVEELILEFMGRAIAAHCPQHSDAFDVWRAEGAGFYDGLLPDRRPDFDAEDAEKTMQRLEQRLEDEFGFRIGE